MAVISLDELKARAEAMRRAGASMAEISRAVGRSPSTLHLWAAQGGWRIVDLEIEGLNSVPSHAPDSLVIPAPPGAAGETPEGAGAGARMECAQGWGDSGSEFAGLAPQKDDRPPAAFPACLEKARSDDPDGSEPQEKSGSRARGTELSPLDAARALHQRSAELGQAGQIRAAEAAARLAERIIRTEAQLLRIDIANPEPDPDGQEEWPGGARAELARRFARIRELQAEQLAQDPDWTPEASGAASEADRFVFSLFGK
ncbi:helix-turn-helix domain-containing protein [Hyphobacterium sp.]|uniref:helix-turn-helix domain-containing protein n=1 Tax=Hyphobacterium sp. TaxID=2004662 RepID=UPI003BA8E6F1